MPYLPRSAHRMSHSTQRYTTRIINAIGNGFGNVLGQISDYVKNIILDKTRAAVRFTTDSIFEMVHGISGYLTTGISWAENVMYIFRLVVSFTDFLHTVFRPFLTLNPKTFVSVTFGFEFYQRLGVLCINLYDICKCLFKKLRPGVAEPEVPEEFYDATPDLEGQAQSGESSLLLNLALATFLPPQLRYIIKDFSIFSNFKLLEDSSVVFDFIGLFFRLPLAIYSYFFPEETEFPRLLKTFEVYFPFGSFGGLKWKLSSAISKLEKKPTLIGDADFQDEFLKIYESYTSFLDTAWDNRKDYPNFVQKMFKQATSIQKKILYMRDSHRKEPSLFVFYGPAGTGKTTLLNKFVQCYSNAGMSVYVHSTASDSKDFHDQYDNEDIYVCDDVGQKGVWQWSNYINMVSTTKFPLECAAVEKKDTKFFTSSTIFCTTNLIDLTITPTCGISCLEALHRRMELLDFSGVKFEDGVWRGTLKLCKYSLVRKRFETVMSVDMSQNVEVVVRQIDGWMRGIAQQKVNNFAASVATPIQLEALPQADRFEELKARFSNLCDYMWRELREALDYLVEFGSNPTNLALIGVVVIFVVPLVRSFIGVRDNMYSTPAQFGDEAVPRLYRADRKEKCSLMEAIPQSLQDVFSVQSNCNFSGLTRISNQTYGVECIYQSNQGQCKVAFCSVFSGRYFTAPAHGVRNVTDEIYVNVYKSNLNRIYDHIRVEKVFEDLGDDVCVLRLPERLPVYAKNLSFAKDSANTQAVLVTPGRQRVALSLRKPDVKVRYVKFEFENVIPASESLLYEYQGDGLCGSMLVTPDAFLLGHHVAFVESIGKGVVRLFSAETRRRIITYFSEKVDFFLPLKEVDAIGSKAMLDKTGYAMPNANNTIVPSMVSGVFPQDRVPARFSDKPLKLMKTLSALACENTYTPDLESLNYATTYVDQIFQRTSFRKWTDSEVVTGGGLLNAIDKRTSVGYGLKGVKEDYIDYDNAKFRPNLSAMVDQFEADVLSGKYPDFFFAEQFKQELRDVEKADKPRIFKMSPLVHTVLIRRYFADFLVYSHKSRPTTGVAVGINPFSDDWCELAQQITAFGDNVFGLDFEKYDKRMLSTFQQALNSVILRKSGYTGNDRKIAEFLLNSIFMTPCVVVDTVYMTTHSLASGGGLTAEYNSWIHKAYMAYAFCSLYKRRTGQVPTVYDYMNNVVNVTYGDDGLVGVSDKVKEWFNGPSVTAEMASIGLAATTESKSTFDYETRSIYSCTFLKRGFVLHPGLGKIVGPLCKKSICSTLNFVKDDFRNHELTTVKLQNFQREAYLHFYDYPNLMSQMLAYCANVNFPFVPLEVGYLRSLYEGGKYAELMALGSI